MSSKEWKQWEQDPDSESRYNIQRVKGDLPEMESTKQLVDLISNVYTDGMNILDVGCNVGHYLSGIRRKFPKLDYVGVDAYSNYIEKAKKSFISNSHAKFEVKDIFQSNSIQDEFENTKNESHIGTKILGENQVIENVICNWSWMKITKN